jgi:hypothetical protein
VRSWCLSAKVDIKISRSTSGVRAPRFDTGAAASPTKVVKSNQVEDVKGEGTCD